MSPRDQSNGDNAPANSTPEQLTSHIQWLRNEVARLKHQLTSSLQERKQIVSYIVTYFFFMLIVSISLVKIVDLWLLNELYMVF